MRTIVFSFSFVLFANFVMAQNDSTHPGGNKKNIVKLNLFALPLKTASIQYERVMTRRISLGLGVRLMPETNLPFRSVIENFVDDSTTLDQLHNLRLGNFAITPELRWYVGKKGAPRGFYIAPFVRYAQYKASLPFTYDDGGKTEKIDMNGTINAITGGILFGAQKKLSKSLMLDFWIFGPSYGSSNGKLDGRKTLTPSEQQSVREAIDGLDIPLTKYTYVVDGNGATINFKGPWAGIRSGLCLGIAF